MRVHDVSELVAQTLEAREEEAFKATGNMLAERESGDLLDGTVTLEEAGIVNGTRLTLM